MHGIVIFICWEYLNVGTINGTDTVAKELVTWIIVDGGGNECFTGGELNLGIVEFVFRKENKQVPEVSNTISDIIIKWVIGNLPWYCV